MILRITGISLQPIPKQVLSEIMTTAGVDSCEVSSVGRSPLSQARVMYWNLVGTGTGQGVAAQMALYMAPGKSVIQVFVDNPGKPKDEVIALMEAKIIELGPETVSKHCSTTMYVWDVAPSSIPADKHQTFLNAAITNPKVKKVLSPYTIPKDPAFHLQVPK